MSRGLWVGGEVIGKIEVVDENDEIAFAIISASNTVGSIIGSHLSNILDYQIVFSIMYAASLLLTSQIVEVVTIPANFSSIFYPLFVVAHNIPISLVSAIVGVFFDFFSKDKETAYFTAFSIRFQVIFTYLITFFSMFYAAEWLFPGSLTLGTAA
jgi:K(+)-stimulated pyrophosphate-energized sodium pump